MPPRVVHANNGACPKCIEILMPCSREIKSWFYDQQALTPELHASWGYRGKIDQNLAKRHGVSDAEFGKSPHNYKPARACDVFFLIDGKANYEIHRYDELAKRLPPNLESGRSFPKPDSNHIQERGWKQKVTNFPNGNS